MPRMRLTLLAAPAAAVLALAGCAGSTASAPSSSAAGEPAASTAAYPVTVTSALGDAVLEQQPTRVATVGWSNQEVPLALGIVPVGMPAVTFGDDDGDGILPWVEDELEELGGETPVLFDETNGIDFEAVADTQPDVILGAYSGLTQEDFDTLSRIAPVVAYPDQPWTASLEDTILLDSAGLGLAAEGEELVAGLDAQIADAAAAGADIAGRTVAFVAPKGPTDFSSLFVYTTSDPRAAFLNQLGFETPDVVAAASEDSTSFYAEISAEDADRLSDVDVFVLYGDEAMLTAMQEDALLGQIPAVQRGSVAAIGADGPIAASANPTPLSIGWGLDDYVALLEAAAAKAE